jgi:hypothetical protein
MPWQTIASAPEGREVWTKIHDATGERNVQKMKRDGRLWWINSGQPDAMYVYYTPTHWSEDRPTGEER